MNTDKIVISVDSDVADAYRAASDDERRKPDLLVNPAFARRDTPYCVSEGRHARN